MTTRMKLGIAAIIGGLILLIPACYAVKYYTADVRGKVAANEQIKANPGFRITAYNHFFDQCAAVQTLEAAIAASEAELARTTAERERGRILANITGQIALRANAVNQYNADSTKSYTVGQFKASNLPYTLSLVIPEGGTQCVV
jgi:hypothetical protein